MSRCLQDRIVNTTRRVGFFLIGWVFSIGLSVGNPTRVIFEYNGLDQQVVNGQSSVAYNTAGDQLKDSQGNQLGFNGWDQQTSMTLADGKAYQYGFCPDGQLCQKQVQGQTLNLYPDQQGNLVDERLDAPETDENGDIGHETLAGVGWAVSGENGRIIASEAVSEANVTAQYAMVDYKGSRLGVMDSTGSLTKATQYSAYGVSSSVGSLLHLVNVSSRLSQPVLHDAVAIGMSVDENPLGYNGQIQNAEDDYVLSETRPYNPDEKRFPNQDLEITEPNLYAFVSGQGGNPVNVIDPSGEIGIPELIAAFESDTGYLANSGAEGRSADVVNAIGFAMEPDRDTPNEIRDINLGSEISGVAEEIPEGREFTMVQQDGLVNYLLGGGATEQETFGDFTFSRGLFGGEVVPEDSSALVISSRGKDERILEGNMREVIERQQNLALRDGRWNHRDENGFNEFGLDRRGFNEDGHYMINENSVEMFIDGRLETPILYTRRHMRNEKGEDLFGHRRTEDPRITLRETNSDTDDDRPQYQQLHDYN